MLATRPLLALFECGSVMGVGKSKKALTLAAASVLFLKTSTVM